MAEPTSRIDPTSSFREPDAPLNQKNKKEKPRLTSRLIAPAPPAESDPADDNEKHELDTVA